MMNIRTITTAAAILCTHYGCLMSEIQMVFMGEHEVALVYPPQDTEPIPEEVVSRIESLSDYMCVKQVDSDDTETPEYMNFSGVVLSLSPNMSDIDRYLTDEIAEQAPRAGRSAVSTRGEEPELKIEEFPGERGEVEAAPLERNDGSIYLQLGVWDDGGDGCSVTFTDPATVRELAGFLLEISRRMEQLPEDDDE